MATEMFSTIDQLAETGVSPDRIIELCKADAEGRILILWKPIEENDGMFTVLYRRPDGVLMGRTDHTAEEAVKNATADYDRALAEKGAADDHK